MIDQLKETDNSSVYVVYNQKLVSMSYIADRKDQFKFGCMRIQDNITSGVGYIKDFDGKIYQIERGKRKAILLKE